MAQRATNNSQTPPNRDQLWAIYLKKNPHWANEGVHLSPEGLRKFVEQVWQHGYKHATATTRVTIQ